MKRVKICLLIMAILFMFLPTIHTDSTEGIKEISYVNDNEEKIYKIYFENFPISQLNEISNKLKIRTIQMQTLNNIEYTYEVKSTDINLEEELMNNYYEYMDSKNSSEFLLKNNNLKIKTISTLNTPFEIKKILKKYDYKIIY